MKDAACLFFSFARSPSVTLITNSDRWFCEYIFIHAQHKTFSLAGWPYTIIKCVRNRVRAYVSKHSTQQNNLWKMTKWMKTEKSEHPHDDAYNDNVERSKNIHIMWLKREHNRERRCVRTQKRTIATILVAKQINNSSG